MGALIMLPGLGGSGRRHWHTHWEAREPAARRFAPSSWDAPELTDWLDALADDHDRLPYLPADAAALDDADAAAAANDEHQDQERRLTA